jgi:ribosomal protein S18 acetylase RimI-like enzyme
VAVILNEPSFEDAADLGRVHQQCWVETYKGLVPPEFWEHSTEARRIGMWERMLRRSEPQRRLVVAEVDGNIVGFALAGATLSREHPGAPPAEALEVRMLYLKRSHHGSGIGQHLLDSVLFAGEAAQLWVAEGNPRAQAFYRRNGFAADGIRDARPHQGTDLTAIRMLRRASVAR